MAIVLIVDRRLPGLHQGHPVHAAVPAVGRVRERAADPEGHAPVRIAGVDVGKVSKVEPLGGDSPGVKVTMKLEDEALPIHEDAEVKVRERIFLEGNLFMDIKPGSPSAGHGRRRGHDPASPRPRRRSSSTRCSARSRPTPARTSRTCSSATARRSTAQPQPGEDDDQDPDVKGETGGAGAQRLARLRARRAARHGDREPGHARHASCTTCRS